ncbi:hypothetical protein DWG18_00885 [Lysobacter sp. TY2-98]|uniref:DapH/DapD/GlmU-related protein n=1 Tax=Lysobacter sp. TY2-98 TaxID=2290922 RepID=UPI000E20533B|nr:DapH/DapD/GlmU-related protein [Lysobacter sp. TY2-98]AXK70983.1 hypothetical protein DWG18_00885 [Lysobacter sp. TY2-98]
MKLIFGAGGVPSELMWLLAQESARSCECIFVTREPSPSQRGLPAEFGEWMAEDDAISRLSDVDAEAYIAVGDCRIRQRIHERVRHARWRFPAVTHARASLDSRPGAALVGDGSIIYPMASLTTGIKLGEFVQVNPGSTIGHGAQVGDYVTACPGAHISGDARIGAGTFVGAGCVILEGVRVASGCVLGAGAVVTRDIDEAGTWIGVPARRQTPRA